jgi:hypothetical protein
LVFQLLAHGSAVAEDLAEELAFHTPLVMVEKFSSACFSEKYAAISLLEIALIENGVGKKI